MRLRHVIFAVVALFVGSAVVVAGRSADIQERLSPGSLPAAERLQATTPVPEWSNQPARMAQEEDAIVGADGTVRWALKRQDKLFLVRSAR